LRELISLKMNGLKTDMQNYKIYLKIFFKSLNELNEFNDFNEIIYFV
jgi:hypothetical protein